MSKKFWRCDGRGKQEGDITKNIPVGVWPCTIAPLGYLRAWYEENKASLISELTETSTSGNRFSKMFGIDLTKYASEYELSRQTVNGYYTNGTASVQQTIQLTNGRTYHAGCQPCKLWAVGWWYRENNTETDPQLTVLPTEPLAGGLGPNKMIDGHLTLYYPYLDALHLNNLNTIITCDDWDDESGKASKNAHNLAQYYSSNIGGEYNIHYIDSVIYSPKNDRLQTVINGLDPTQQVCYLYCINDLIYGYTLCDIPGALGGSLFFKQPVRPWTPDEVLHFTINDFNTYIISVIDGNNALSMDQAVTFGNTHFNTQTTNIKWRGFLCIGGPREELDEVLRL